MAGQGASSCRPKSIGLDPGWRNFTTPCGKNWRTSTHPSNRTLRMESLENRALLSVTMAPTISGTVYEDTTGAGIIANDTPLANVTVHLWRDGGVDI